MDSFIVKCDDAESVIRKQSEIHLKDKMATSEPPLKKTKHGADTNEKTLETDADLNTSVDKDTSFDSTCSGTQSDGSPERKTRENDDNCLEEKEKVRSPKSKRRKLSTEEIEKRRRAKEEARLTREQKKEEKLKKEQEREEMRLKREKDRQAKREQLEKERVEKQLRKEKLDKERLEKQKKKDEMNLVKEEEKKKKEEERKLKEEEKRLKDEEKKKKDEEKKKKEEEKRLKEEEEQRKKDKVKESFKSFFIKKSPPKKVSLVDEKCQMFAPFEVKPNMKMAPVLRRTPVESGELFSEVVEKQDSAGLYIDELRKRKSEQRIDYITGRTLRQNESSKDNCKDENEDGDADDLLIIENEDLVEKENGSIHIMRVKLLQFSENYRPPYYGTWRKSSCLISPRNPFKKDEELLSYEIDSDEEWEEEEPGESLSGPENEDDDEEEEENDEENDGFFVPHGYLSDDEGIHDSDGEKQDENVDIRDKKLDKTEGFPFEGKGKFKQLRATCFGSAWFHSPADVPHFLSAYKITPIATLPIDIFNVKERSASNEPDPEGDVPKSGTTTPRSGNNAPLKVPEEAMPLLINFVHKNSLGMSKLIIRFLDIWNKRREGNGNDTSAGARISKRQLEKRILEIAKRDGATENSKSCYLVHQQIWDQYKQELEKLELEKAGSQSSNGDAVQAGECSKSRTEREIAITRTEICSNVPVEGSDSCSANVRKEPSEMNDKCSHLIDPERSTRSDELNSSQIQREIITI